ncbi:RHE_PE00001 family protein [Mesorhizobium sp. ISC15]|uniref:RHE_PE00001 family protein n=1 Tax=Mesorhizobium sp. ISC15 TaxID=3076429 RepID=UPI00301DFB9C
MTLFDLDRTDAIPWRDLAGPLVTAEDSLARLDERLARSPVREGFVARTHFYDAAAALWLEGELVHVEDLVLHDTHMDIRTPTHELTRAHAVLRARRLIVANRPDWALSPNGLGQLRGRGASAQNALPPERHATAAEGAGDEKADQSANDDLNDGLGAEFAAIDALLDRTRNVLDGLAAAPVSRPQQVPTDEKNPLVYDPDWDEEERLADWRAMLNRTTGQPPVLSAALLWDAWETKEPLQHLPWLGHLLVGAMLRQVRKTSAHLVCLNTGLRAIPRERRRARDRTARLIGFLEGVTEAAVAGLKEHDRLMLAREQMGRRLRGRRGHSKLPQLVDLVLARPVVSSAMIEKDLKVTTRGALNLVAELGLREITGRGRYRAWGIL